MHMLQDAGMTNREACFNTVRNITTCVWSGIARDEVFDVRPYAQKLAYAMLRQNADAESAAQIQDRVRWMQCTKIASPETINDLGLRAVVRDGKRGFRIVVGGGLGPLPVEAQLLDEFLPEERLINRVEAVIRVFNKHGNRKNRNTARIKFLVRSRGIAWVKEQIEKEFRRYPGERRHCVAGVVPEGFGGYQSTPQPLGKRRAAAGGESVGRAMPHTMHGSRPTWWSSAKRATRP